MPTIALALLLVAGAAYAYSGQHQIQLWRASEGEDATRADAARELGGEESMLTNSYVSTYEIVRTFEHDKTKFTQGLVFGDDGTLYESAGLYHKSVVRSVQLDVTDGKQKTISQDANDPHHFAEGLAIKGNKLMQLTWKEKVINEFTVTNGVVKKTRTVPRLDGGREGWGLALAPSGDKLYLTDSGADLYTLALEMPGKPDYSELDRKRIVDPKLTGADGTTAPFGVYGVNEIEMVDGEIWGNVYPMYQGTHSECIVRINASTAEVIGWIDMHGLFAKQEAHVTRNPGSYVLNGIAYHAKSGRLYVTGKEWDKMYQVRIKEDPSKDAEHVKRVCGLGNINPRRSGRKRG